jgi:hypothetical protein
MFLFFRISAGQWMYVGQAECLDACNYNEDRFKKYRCFTKSIANLIAYIHFYSEDKYSVLNCHNVARHTDFCLV